MNKLKLTLLTLFVFSLVLFLTGCSGSITNQSPSTIFTAAYPSDGNAPLDVYFDASDSYDPDGVIVSYQWSVDGNNIGNGETINHTFQSSGSYSVSLTVTDSDGATDVGFKTIDVQADEKLEVSVYEVYADPGAFDADDLYLVITVEGTTKRIPGSSSQPDWWNDVSGWEKHSGSETFDIAEDQTYFDVEVDIWDADTASAEDDHLAQYTYTYNKDTEEVTLESSYGESKADFKANFFTVND